MRVQLPFAYKIDVKLKANKSAVARTLVDFVEREVPEVTAGEAPIAVKWRESGYRSHGAPFTRNQAHVRFFDGDFYVPATATRLDGAGLFTTDMLPGVPGRNTAYDDRLSDVFGRNWDGLGTPLMYGMQSFLSPNRDGPVAYSPERGADVVGSNRERNHAVSEAVIGSLLVVDDCVWRKCAEPVLMVLDHAKYAGRPNERHGVVAVCCEIPRYGARVHVSNSAYTVLATEQTRFYRVDRFDEMRENLGHAYPEAQETMTSGRGGYETLTSTVDDVRVIMPELLAFDAMANAAAREVGRCLGLARKGVAKFPGGHGGIARVEDLCDVFYRSGDIAVLAEAVAAVPGVFEETGGLNRERRGALEMLRSLDDTTPISINQRGFAP